MNTPEKDAEAQAVLDVLEGHRDARSDEPQAVRNAQSIREASEGTRFREWLHGELKDYSPSISDEEIRALNGDKETTPANVVDIGHAKAPESARPAVPRPRWWRMPNSLAASIVAAAITAGVIVKIAAPPQSTTVQRGESGTEWQIAAAAPAVTASQLAESLRAAGFTVRLTEQPGNWILNTKVSEEKLAAARRVLEQAPDAEFAGQVKLRPTLVAGELWIVFYPAAPPSR